MYLAHAVYKVPVILHKDLQYEPQQQSRQVQIKSDSLSDSGDSVGDKLAGLVVTKLLPLTVKVGVCY